MSGPIRDHDPQPLRWLLALWLYAPFCIAQGLVFTGSSFGPGGQAQPWSTRIEVLVTCLAVGTIPGLAATLTVQLIRQGVRISTGLIGVALVAVLLVTARAVFAGS